MSGSLLLKLLKTLVVRFIAYALRAPKSGCTSPVFFPVGLALCLDVMVLKYRVGLIIEIDLICIELENFH